MLKEKTEAEAQATKGYCKSFDAANSTDISYLPVGWEDDLQIILSITLFWDGAKTQLHVLRIRAGLYIYIMRKCRFINTKTFYRNISVPLHSKKSTSKYFEVPVFSIPAQCS